MVLAILVLILVVLVASVTCHSITGVPQAASVAMPAHSYHVPHFFVF
eukprot:SAG11_NODE_34241_length_273_cov_0.591954_1_plen_46_part_01